MVHNRLKAAVTTRKTIFKWKRKIIDRKYILIMPEVLNGLVTAEKEIKKGRLPESKRVKGWQIQLKRSLVLSLKLARLNC